MSRTRAQVIGGFYRRDENTSRGNWSGRLDYPAVQLAFLLDLPSVWWLPLIASGSGGGVFWLILCLLTVLLGIPLLYLESAWGQFAGVGAISMWNVTPICKGIGYATVLASFIWSCYYAVYCCWALLYFFRGFSTTLIEEVVTCSHQWNTYYCSAGGRNLSAASDYPDGPSPWSSPAVEFYRSRLHTRNTGIAPDLGSIEPATAACLLATWVLVFLAVGFGARVLGKIAFSLTAFLYLLGFVFLVRTGSLPGSWEGVMGVFSFHDRWYDLYNYRVWGNAVSIMVSTAGVGFGVIPTLASFNHFNDHSNAESGFIIPVVVLSKMILSFIVFSLFGFLSETIGIYWTELTESGAGFVFGTMFHALSFLPGRQAWIVMFYLAMFLLGLSTLMCLTFTIVTAVVDEFPVSRLSRRGWHMLLTAAVCVVCFLFGLFFITTGGYNSLGLIQTYSLLMVPFFVAAGCVIISWIYGFPRFFTDVQLMYGYRPFPAFKVFWGALTPFGIIVSRVFSLYSTLDYANQVHSDTTKAIGNLLYLATLSPIVIYAAVYAVRNNPTDVIQGPSPAWGPQVAKHRERYEATLAERPLLAPPGVPTDTTLSGQPLLSPGAEHKDTPV